MCMRQCVGVGVYVWVCVGLRVIVLDSNLSFCFCGKCEIEGHFSLIYGNTIKCECGNLDFMYVSSIV